MPAPGKAAVIGKRLGKSHADARARGSGEADEKCVIELLRGECSREYREPAWKPNHPSAPPAPAAQSAARTGGAAPALRLPSHWPGSFSSSSSCARCSWVALFVGKIIEQLPYAGILREGRCLFIKAARLHFHGAGFLADRFDAHRPDQPQRRTLHESAHILPADQRNVFAKLLPVEFDQSSAGVRILLRACLRTWPRMRDNPAAVLRQNRSTPARLLLPEKWPEPALRVR